MRSLRRNPGFTAAVVSTLSICIGANATTFSVLNAALLKPLAYTEPDRIVRLPPMGTDQLAAWRSSTKTLSSMALYRSTELTLGGRDESIRLAGMEVSPELFEVLGSSAMLGRALLAGDSDVIAVSYRTWMRYLGGDPGALNRFVRLDGVQYQVVGVMSEGFAFPSRDTDFWISLPTHAADRVRGRSGTVVSAVGRLREGISIEQARAEASSIAAALNVSRIEVVTLLEHTTAPVRPALWVLQAAGVFVLLIACVNITSLLLARTTDRRREFAVRTAVGAGRVRLARHVLTESVLLAALGAIVGYPLSFLGVKLVLPLARSSIPYLDEIGPDPLVLAFTLGVSLTCGLLCGLVPAITMSERELLGSLKMGGLSGTSDRRATRTHALLVIAEVALALVLLVAAGLLITSFRQLATVNPGYSPQGVLTFHVALPDARYPLIEHRRGFYSDLLNRIDELPEVQSAGVTNVLPFRFSMFGTTFSINGIRQPAMTPGGMPYSFKVVSPAYFDSMGIPIVKGRGFRDIDRLNGPPVIALSETFARAHFANEDPIGKYIQFMRHSWEVVGVINDVKHVGLDQEPWAEIYLSKFVWVAKASRRQALNLQVLDFVDLVGLRLRI